MSPNVITQCHPLSPTVTHCHALSSLSVILEDERGAPTVTYKVGRLRLDDELQLTTARLTFYVQVMQLASPAEKTQYQRRVCQCLSDKSVPPQLSPTYTH